MKFFLTLVLVVYSTAQANELRRFDATIIEIVDGDTLWLGVGSQKIKTRLSGIDAPEVSRGAQRGQPWGDEARTALARLAPLYATATCQDSGQDAYGRKLCRLFINGLDVALELVRSGNAWVDARYARDPALYGAQQQASHLRVGLWSRTPAVEPSTWRRDCAASSDVILPHCSGVTAVVIAKPMPPSRPATEVSWFDRARIKLRALGLI